MRPDGAAGGGPGSATSTPSLRKATAAAAAAPAAARALPAGLSKAAAGAAVFVPKSSGGSAPPSGTVKTDEGGSASQQPPTSEFRTMGVSGSATSATPNGADNSSIPSGGLNPYARAVAGPGSSVFTPASGRATPSGYSTPGGGYERDTMVSWFVCVDYSGYSNAHPIGQGSTFDPTYTGPITPRIGAEVPTAGPPPADMRPFNPYAHMEQQEQAGYEDASSGSHQHQRPVRQPLQYHLSAPPLPHTSNLHPQHLAHHAHFMSPSLREDLFRRNEAINVSAPSVAELGGTQARPPQPDEVHVYRDLVPLEPDSSGGLPFGSRGNPVLIGGVPTQLLPRHLLPFNQHGLLTGMGSLSSLPISASGGPLAPSSALGGYPTEVHRATCTLDGKAYVLRRVVGFNLGRERERALEAVERWRRLRCPGVVNVREAFTSWRWGEASIVFVYDFHPHATTLFAEHLLPKPPRVDPRTGRMQAVDMHVPERTLWSYLCQLASALRSVHRHGLAVRCIEPGKVVKTGRNRVRFNCCSVLDVLTYDPHHPPNGDSAAQLQTEDLYKLGALILSLACVSVNAVGNLTSSLDSLSRHYSKELNDVVRWLLSDPAELQGGKTSDELLCMIGPHLAEELDASENYSDLLEESLSKELENARLVRLLCKMGFINERPEYDHDPNWSNTGERYLISMFRDYVFHSVTSVVDEHHHHHHHHHPHHPPPHRMKPVVDLSHVLSNLNRLDAGSEDKLMLTSRDEQSCLVVSYKEVSQWVRKESSEAASAQTAPRHADQGGHRLGIQRSVAAFVERIVCQSVSQSVSIHIHPRLCVVCGAVLAVLHVCNRSHPMQ